MVLNTIGILLPSISKELDLSPAEQGILVSSAFWGNLLLAIPLSWWMSRYRPKLLTTVTMAIGTALLFLQAWAPAFGVMLLGRLAFGVSIIAREPARAALIQQWFQRREVVFVNGVGTALYGAIVGGGLALAPVVLSVMDGDWRTTLAIFGASFGVLTVAWTVFGRERGTDGEATAYPLQETGLIKRVLGYRDLWIAGAGFMGAVLAQAAFLSFLPTMLLHTYDVPLHWSGKVLAVGTGTGGPAGLIVGYLVMKRSNGKTFLTVFGAVMVLTYIAIVVAGLVPLLLVLAFINGITWGFWPILHAVPFHLPGVAPREVAVALAFIMTMISAGTVSGPLVAGVLQETLGDLRLVLFLIGFAPLSLVAAGALLWTTGRVRRIAEQEA